MFVLMAIMAYLLGAIPVGFVLTKFIRGIDIRKYGSGNFGATNVYRVVGKIPGIVVLVLDMLKGFIPVTLFGDLLLQRAAGLDPIFVRTVMAMSAVCGHNWTIFLGFKGGKGIATTAGALLGLSLTIPQLGLIMGVCLAVWLIVVLITGFVSLGSMAAALTLPICMILFNQPFKLLIFSAILCLFAMYRHKSNIRKLLQGEEKKVFSAKKH